MGWSNNLTVSISLHSKRNVLTLIMINQKLRCHTQTLKYSLSIKRKTYLYFNLSDLPELWLNNIKQRHNFMENVRQKQGCQHTSVWLSSEVDRDISFRTLSPKKISLSLSWHQFSTAIKYYLINDDVSQVSSHQVCLNILLRRHKSSSFLFSLFWYSILLRTR